MLPFSESIWNPPSDFVPLLAVVELVLFCAFLFVTGLAFISLRPTYVEESFLHPASFQKELPRHMSMLFSPFFLRFLP